MAEKFITTDLTKQKQATPTPSVEPKTVEPIQSPEVLALKSKITSWTGSAADNYAYNKATWDNNAARNAMLWSKELVESDKLNTRISLDEAQMIKDAWVKKAWANVKLSQDAYQEYKASKWEDISTPKTPTPTTSKTPATNAPKIEAPQPIQTPENIQQWKEQGSDLWTLWDMIESKYGTITTQTENGWLRATIWDKSYEWAIDDAWNPIKTEVQLTPAEKYRTEQLQRYMNASTDDIYRGLISGNISKEMETDLSLNPNFALAKEKQAKQMSADSTNKQMESVFNKMTGKTVEETNLVADMWTKMFQDKLGKGVSAEWLQSYKQFIEQDAKFTADVKELNAKVLESKTLQRAADDNLDILTGQYEGVSRQSLLMLNARQNKELYNQMDALNDDISNLQASVTYQEKVLDRDYSARVAEYNKLEERAYNQSVLDEQRLYNEELTADEREYAEQQEIAQLERQYDYTYGDLNSENETVRDIAIERAVADLYTNYPIPWMEVAATKVEKVKNLIAQWMTWSQALSQVEQEIRNTQSYKDMVSKYQRDLQPVAETVTPTNDWTKLDDDTLYNQKTWESKPVWAVTPWAYLKSLWNWNITWYGGEYDGYRWLDIDWAIWDPITFPEPLTVISSWVAWDFGNSMILERANWDRIRFSHNDKNLFKKWDTIAANEVFATVGNTWNVIAWKWGDGSHIDIVVQKANGQYMSSKAVEQYLKWIGSVPVSESEEAAPSAEEKAPWYFDTTSSAQFTNFLQSGKIGTNSDEAKMIQEEFWSIEEFKRQAHNFNWSEGWPATKELEKIEGLKEHVTRLWSDQYKTEVNNSVWKIQTVFGWGDKQERDQFLADVENFLDGKTLQQLIDVKAEGATFWALSNEELKMLQNSASKLNKLAIRKKDSEWNETWAITWFKWKEDGFRQVLAETVKTYQEIINKKKSFMSEEQKKLKNDVQAMPRDNSDPLGIWNDTDPLGLWL